jgi:glucose-6-phosphate isomerase
MAQGYSMDIARAVLLKDEMTSAQADIWRINAFDPWGVWLGQDHGERP